MPLHRNSSVSNTAHRSSVLDTLLNRDISECIDLVAPTSNSRRSYSEIEYASSAISSQSTMSDDVQESTLSNGPSMNDYVSDTRRMKSHSSSTKTPTTRSEQLKLLLARTYFTAPACLLKFVNNTSSIRHGSCNRDSEGTVIDDEFLPILDCVMETNDEIDCSNSELNSTSIADTHRTSLTSNSGDRENYTLIDTTMIADSRMEGGSSMEDLPDALLSSRVDGTTNTSSGLNDSSRSLSTDNCYTSVDEPSIHEETRIDAGTDPITGTDLICAEDILMEDPGTSNLFEETEEGIADELSNHMEPTLTEGTNNPEERSVSTSVASSGSTGEVKSQDSTAELKKENGSAYNGIDGLVSKVSEAPVYCRSLLYRIRVPLSKRLKNMDETIQATINTPKLNESHVNLSCVRLSSSRVRTIDEDSINSSLHLSDLDGTSSSECNSVNYYKFIKRTHQSLDNTYKGVSSNKNRLLIDGKCYIPGKFVSVGDNKRIRVPLAKTENSIILESLLKEHFK